jgi:hypothetical protein
MSPRATIKRLITRALLKELVELVVRSLDLQDRRDVPREELPHVADRTG